MRFRDQVALTLPSLILRLMLAIIFLWAGGFKVFTTTYMGPEQAAKLAALGVTISPAQPAATVDVPDRPLPDPEEGTPAAPDQDQREDAGTDTSAAAPSAPLREPVTRVTEANAPFIAPVAYQPAQPVNEPDEDADTPTTDAAPPAAEPDLNASPLDQADPVDASTPPVLNDPADTGESTPPPAPASPETETATPADFPNGADVRTLYGLALSIDNAANPPLDAQSNLPEPYWPQYLGTGHWPRTLAWAVALGELACGVALLIGLLTRVAALGVVSIMLGAMWLTQIGPAIQSGNTFLGFLPNNPINDPSAWTPLLFQFSLFCAGLAVFLLGSGAIGLDRALFRRSPDTRYDTEPSYKPAEEYAKRPSM